MTYRTYPHLARSFVASLGFSLVFALAAPAFAQMGGPPPVTVAKPVVKQIVELDEYTGRFEASATVDIRARVNGYLEKLSFAEGSMVREGELLAVIDRRPYVAALNQAQAALNSLQTKLDFAKQDADRYERLARSGTAAERTAEEKRQAFQQAQADIQGARASVESARLNLSFTEIRAPMSGRIGRKLVNEGNLVSENQTLLATIVALDPVYFYFDVDERSYLAYRRMAANGGNGSNANGANGNAGANGLEVGVELADEKSFPHKGKLDFTDSRLDAATGSMRMRAALPNQSMFLTPGMFGRIAVPGSPKYEAVLIPDEAIVTDLSRRFVYVVGEGGAVRQQPVETGSRTDNYRIVRKGLKGDETVVINGLQRVRMGGGKVTPMPVQMPPVWAGLMALPQPQMPQAAPKQGG
ncbi:efflux RND transporter periplasmic adaptor subunit [Ferrovibrio sp.]|uniref:efflux RND transporter periplasmic adaptor subunit n=1 Tax=Ferrovibrio sp. TaxID=1917215 RepID=UPI0025B9AC16|nr:efflux RND transporter periplasmic adaptor subunit [Ferrovibrio sp.]MBX3453489.1 efflux RND transporter periplasmic adaptor subunit [Ferrovibrio sp.]